VSQKQVSLERAKEGKILFIKLKQKYAKTCKMVECWRCCCQVGFKVRKCIGERLKVKKNSLKLLGGGKTSHLER